MKRYFIPVLSAAAALMVVAACNQADKMDFGKEIVLVTGTDSSPVTKIGRAHV